MKRDLFMTFVVTCALLAGTGCAPRAPLQRMDDGMMATQVSVAPSADEPPGVVRQIWEEPQIEVIQVPPGLDPEGHFYRPAHQAVVEVKPGRWRYYHLD